MTFAQFILNFKIEQCEFIIFASKFFLIYRTYLEIAKMEQPIDIRALEEAVLIFYRSNSNEQAAAHEWLTRVQCSRQAWSFVWELMAPNKVN